jgi:hypothetical protein
MVGDGGFMASPRQVKCVEGRITRRGGRSHGFFLTVREVGLRSEWC